MGQGDSKQKRKDKLKPDKRQDSQEPAVLEIRSVLPEGPMVNDNDFVTSIPDEKTWLAFKHEPTDRSFAHVQVVKVVVPVSDRVRSEYDLFFIQSDKWVFHWNFTRDIVKDPGSQDLRTFNDLNYQKEDRDWVCLTVTKYLDQGMYSFELAARDCYSHPKIVAVYQLLKSKMYFGDKLHYRPLSKLHQKIVDSAADKSLLPIIESDQLFGGVKYQPLTIGTTYGYLRLVREGHEEEDVDKARWNDILLCESIPNDLPVIAGLITSVLQTPLCHVALLCGNRGTPNMAGVGAAENSDLVALINKPVKFVVRMSDYTVEPATDYQVEQWQQRVFEKLRQGLNVKLEGDVGQSQLVRFAPTLAADPMEYSVLKLCIGAKAINCLDLARKKVGSPLLHSASFVIPYFFYYDIMRRIFQTESSSSGNEPAQNGVKSPKQLMEGLISDSKQNATPDPKDYAQQCAQIRKLITAVAINLDDEEKSENGKGEDTGGDDKHFRQLIVDIEKEIEAWEASGLWNRCDGIIFRSSTNAEDIEGFNAAGLYESIPVLKSDLGSMGKEHTTQRTVVIMRALKKVWASVWNFRGFEERRIFGLDSSQVQMAILCQPLFSTSQRCNGVAVTAHPTRHDFPGALINLQKSGFLVTDSCGGARPEQHVIWMYGRQQTVIETMCLSSLMDGLALMSEEEICKLVPMLTYLDDQFGHNTPGTRSNIVKGTKKTKFCVDVEFLVMNDTGEIVILQCRPYKMVYEYDLARNPDLRR